MRGSIPAHLKNESEKAHLPKQVVPPDNVVIEACYIDLLSDEHEQPSKPFSVIFKVQCPHALESGQEIKLVGSIPELGSWYEYQKLTKTA